MKKYLIDEIDAGQANESQIDFAVDLEVPTAIKLKIISGKLSEQELIKRKKTLASRDSTEALWLGEYFKSKNNTAEAIAWLNESIRQGSSQAKLQLAQLYYEGRELTKAQLLLDELYAVDEANRLNMEIAIEKGEKDKMLQLQKLTDFYVYDKTFFSQLETYEVLLFGDQSHNARENYHQDSQCQNIIQPFASRLSDLIYFDQVIENVKTHPIASYFCFLKPKYIPITKLSCEAKKGKPITCDELSWQTVKLNSEVKYISVMLPEGGANVHSGIMYLDSRDTEKVFAHELSHFLGLIDEYPLANNHRACLNPEVRVLANNIVLMQDSMPLSEISEGELKDNLLSILPWANHIKPTTPLFQKVGSNWKIGTPQQYAKEIGLFITNTCELENLNAFKPVSTPTIMENNDYELPDVYNLLISNSNNIFGMPSYHYNVAQAMAAAEVNGFMDWLELSLKKEHNKTKQLKIQNGLY